MKEANTYTAALDDTQPFLLILQITSQTTAPYPGYHFLIAHTPKPVVAT